ncbi:hypothetical protein AMECASPLE_036786 [Ameca splendens]|uniref:Uncharacterized protein n=1 Tax=Ameca splendens TaxID=208324 RepID=A0ABV0ZSP3_9TELE
MLVLDVNQQIICCVFDLTVFPSVLHVNPQFSGFLLFRIQSLILNWFSYPSQPQTFWKHPSGSYLRFFQSAEAKRQRLKIFSTASCEVDHKQLNVRLEFS